MTTTEWPDRMTWPQVRIRLGEAGYSENDVRAASEACPGPGMHHPLPGGLHVAGTDPDGLWYIRAIPVRPATASARYEARWLREIRDIAADAAATDAQAGGRIRALLYPACEPHGGGTAEGCPGCFPPGEAIRREIPRRAGEAAPDGCGHEPEGREIALAPGYEPGPDEYESWYPHLASGHKLSRDQIAQHGRDRYPSPAAQYAKILDEAGELGEALINWAGTEAPECFARVRAEYADTGLALYALGDKLGLDLIECMAGLVAGDTRSFAEAGPGTCGDGQPHQRHVYSPDRGLIQRCPGVRE